MHARRVALYLCLALGASSPIWFAACGGSESARQTPETSPEETSSDATGGDVSDTTIIEIDTNLDTGLCWGLETCTGLDGWSECNAPQPTAEVCDGVDNNCNLFTDENLVDDTPCEKANDFGTCIGRRVCQGATGFECVAPEAQAETCNFADDDCDGQVDEDFADPISGLYATDANCGVCGNECTGLFPNAVSGCAADGTSARCVVESCLPGFIRRAPRPACRSCERPASRVPTTPSASCPATRACRSMAAAPAPRTVPPATSMAAPPTAATRATPARQ